MKLKKFASIDKVLVTFVILSALYGIAAIYSATYSFGTYTNTIVQSGAFLLGLGVMILISIFDYEQFEILLKPIAAFCIFLLILVKVIGTAGSWGAQSWIRLGPIGIQPSEIAKIGFILTFSFHLSKVTDKINEPKTLLLLLLHLGVPAFLIMLQPDLGSTMVFIFMFIVMVFTAGISIKYILSSALVGIVSLPIIYFFLLSDYQKHRILVFLNPEIDKLGSGYNVIQSKIAVGSGGFFGKGYLNGTQNQLGFLPTKHTDFIFSVISEELGFIGAMLVVIFLSVVIYRCIRAALKSKSLFGRYICIGVSAMFIFHAIENIGMCIGLTPVTGIPLPFFSYGGTSLLTNLVAVGLVLSVGNYTNKKKY